MARKHGDDLRGERQRHLLHRGQRLNQCDDEADGGADEEQRPGGEQRHLDRAAGNLQNRRFVHRLSPFSFAAPSDRHPHDVLVGLDHPVTDGDNRLQAHLRLGHRGDHAAQIGLSLDRLRRLPLRRLLAAHHVVDGVRTMSAKPPGFVCAAPVSAAVRPRAARP